MPTKLDERARSRWARLPAHARLPCEQPEILLRMLIGESFARDVFLPGRLDLECGHQRDRRQRRSPRCREAKLLMQLAEKDGAFYLATSRDLHRAPPRGSEVSVRNQRRRNGSSEPIQCGYGPTCTACRFAIAARSHTCQRFSASSRCFPRDCPRRRPVFSRHFSQLSAAVQLGSRAELAKHAVAGERLESAQIEV